MHFFPWAASDKDGYLTFYTLDPRDTDPSHLSIDGGAGFFPRKDRKQIPYEVKAVQLSTFLANVLLYPGSKINIPLMKIDIEGAEYQVLPDMLKWGLLCNNKITKIYTEFHTKFQYLLKPAFSTYLQLVEAIENQTTCTPTKIRFLNDEDYCEDV